MIKYFTIISLALVSMQAFSQTFNTDIFGNLQYRSKRGFYRATLKQDIFDNLIFTDSRGNNITFEEEYLELKLGPSNENPTGKRHFFGSLIHQYRNDTDYEAHYSIDILGQIVVKDNREHQLIFQDEIYQNDLCIRSINNSQATIRLNLDGYWEYNSLNTNATLVQNIFNRWVYEDSSGNKLKFSHGMWTKLLNRCGDQKNVFLYLIDEYLEI